MQYLALIFSLVCGFFLNLWVTKPETRINRRLPFIKIKVLELSPCIKIHIRNKILHLHHWMSYSFLLLMTITIVNGGILDLMYLKGFFVGGIVQGLTFQDWKKIIYNQE